MIVCTVYVIIIRPSSLQLIARRRGEISDVRVCVCGESDETRRNNDIYLRRETTHAAAGRLTICAHRLWYVTICIRVYGRRRAPHTRTGRVLR